MNIRPAGLLVATMISVIVGVDVALLRDKPWARLIANLGIVAAFGIGYCLLTRR